MSETAKVSDTLTPEPASMEPKRDPVNAESPKKGPEKPMNKDKTSREQKPDKEGPNEDGTQNTSEMAKVPDTPTPELASQEPKSGPPNVKTPKRGPEKPRNKDNCTLQYHTLERHSK